MFWQCLPIELAVLSQCTDRTNSTRYEFCIQIMFIDRIESFPVFIDWIKCSNNVIMIKKLFVRMICVKNDWTNYWQLKSVLCILINFFMKIQILIQIRLLYKILINSKQLISNWMLIEKFEELYWNQSKLEIYYNNYLKCQ
jgi:hypothetical protein